MKTVYLIRDDIGRKQCLGAVLVMERARLLFNSHLLERGWLNNARNISCTTAGTYPLKLEWSPTFEQMLWEAYGIPNRSECKFHPANRAEQLNGCYAPGEARFDMDGDGDLDVINSGLVFEEFMNAFGDDTEARLVIINDKH